ncbi:MAG TPA: hypothetical protein VHX65_14840 [Pirellulales bacterium]|jgi:hypothetical protein|nr:hypothetical protein [Pirellulales bacterium]
MIARETPLPTDSTNNGPNAGPQTNRLDPEEGSPVDPSPLAPLLRHLAELQMLVGHYLRARADQISSRVRMVLFWAVAGIVGLFVGVAFMVTAVVFILRGIVTGLIALGLQPWAADVITGVVCIAAVASFIAIGFLTQRSAFRRKRRDDYEHFRARYRAKFGHGFDEAGQRDK